RAVLAALDVADRLRVDADLIGQVLAGDVALGPQHGDPVVDDVSFTTWPPTHATDRSINATFCNPFTSRRADPGEEVRADGYGGNLAALLTSTQRSAIKQALESARERASRASQAEASGNHAEAIRLWRIIFGS